MTEDMNQEVVDRLRKRTEKHASMTVEKPKQVEKRRVFQLSTWEFMDNLHYASSVEEKDRIVYKPLRLHVEGSFVDEFLSDLGKVYNLFNDVDVDSSFTRVENKEDADILIVISPVKEYEFHDLSDGDQIFFEMFEHLKFSHFEITSDAEARLLLSLREQQEAHKWHPHYTPRIIPERAIDLLTGDDNRPGWCCEHFENRSIVLLSCDVFARFLKEKGLLNAPRSTLDFEKEKFLTLFYMNRPPPLKVRDWAAVFAGLSELQEQPGQEPDAFVEPMVISESWLGLRELAADLCSKRGMSVRDTVICSEYMVPEESQMTNVDLLRSLKERELVPSDLRQPTFNAVTRKVSKRKVLSLSDLGTLAEHFTHSLLVAGVECFVGPAASKVCDISDVESGDPAKAEWSVNVKWSLEDEVNRSFECSPEFMVSKSWVLLVMSRHLTMRLYPITGELTTINSHSGGLCVTPEGLAETVKGLIESAT